MTQSLFLQIHTLTSYSGVLLNRDDVGFAKRMPFGGSVRTRVSSQCMKRHWRCFDGEGSLRAIDGTQMSVRSRRTFEEFVLKPLVAEGATEAVAVAVTEELKAIVLGASQKKTGKSKKGGEEPETPAEEGDAESRTGQVTVLGRPEMEYVLGVARRIVKECGPNQKKAKDAVKAVLGGDGLANLRTIRLGAGLDAALFGRMVTGDVLARCDAAIHVAHAFTVHEEAAENDYFAAVDDLVAAAGEETGSGHIGSNELTSGLFYGYVVVDVPLLVSNVESCARANWRGADRKLAGEIVRRFVRLVSTVTPGAKLGSTAPYSYASLVGIESGDAQPRTLANAFLKPVRSGADMLGGAYRALSAHAKDLDAMYGADGARRFAGLEPVDALGGAVGERLNMTELAAWAGDQVLD
jgi:CRISPR system Cascade subunit CasC